MSKVTRATKMLEQAGISFTVQSYTYDPAASRIGLQAAEALGEEPGACSRRYVNCGQRGLQVRLKAQDLVLYQPSDVLTHLTVHTAAAL